MNNGTQGQPAQGQPSSTQQQKARPSIYRPEHMRQLPDKFTADEKLKWEQGLKALYNQLENNPADSPQHTDAKRKIFEFSKTLYGKMQNHRLQMQQAQQGQASAGTRPASQGQPQGQGGENGGQNPNPNAAQQPRPQPKISQKIMEHVTSFPFVLPPNITQGTPEAGKWIQEAKGRYVKGLVTMENCTGQIAALDTMLKNRNEEGKPLTPEEEKDYKEKKETAQRNHANAKNYVDGFRQQQQQQRAAQNAAQQGNASQPNPPQHAGNGAANGGHAPARPSMNITQVQQQPPNPALQNTQTVNAAIEAARNQQMGGGRPITQNGQAPQIPNQNAPAHPNIPQHQGGPVQNIKQEAGVPQINTAVNQGRPMNNSPQTAVPQSAGPQSATAQQVPRALTHQAALQTAARSYSSGQTSGTPNVMGHSHPHPPAPRETQNVITNKMPIPKHLPERATAPPQAVPMPQSRPTFTGGPSNAGNGVLSQPALQKTPGYNMEGDGDRVLNKKKLDELVRQVTGGGEGLGDGEGLTPEVEESILNVADSFVDQVLQAACKNAKERGSKILEIRDIQLTLERGYNIRIPGYASDEIRTVRKIQPSPAWISKMSAVQAAKVTGGKNSD